LMTSALESSIHMTMSLRASIKESLSSVSQNGGNLLASRFAGRRRPDIAPERLIFCPDP